MKIDWKKAIGLTAAVAMLVPLAACGGSDNGGSDKKASGTQNITLSVWAPQEDQAKNTNWLGKVEENFAKAHPEYNITWKNDVVSEGDASKQVSTDPSAAADVYMFASDQLGVLMDAKAIGQLGTDAEKQVKEQNGDLEVNSVTGTDGKLYGVPYTDNTWFMYYNKSKITEDEAKDFDAMLAKAKVTFPMSNSRYVGGFFDGLTLFGEKGTEEKGEKKGGFSIDLKNIDNFTQMLGGFTVLRLTSMVGMVGVSFTKEELLKYNKQLNMIKKPRKK